MSWNCTNRYTEQSSVDRRPATLLNSWLLTRLIVSRWIPISIMCGWPQLTTTQWQPMTQLLVLGPGPKVLYWSVKRDIPQDLSPVVLNHHWFLYNHLFSECILSQLAFYLLLLCLVCGSPLHNLQQPAVTQAAWTDRKRNPQHCRSQRTVHRTKAQEGHQPAQSGHQGLWGTGQP